jgi:hypothetical protein
MEQDTGFWPGRGEPTQDDLAREFPDWLTARWPSGLWTAKIPGRPDAFVQGEDLSDLRDMIRGWNGRNA